MKTITHEHFEKVAPPILQGLLASGQYTVQPSRGFSADNPDGILSLIYGYDHGKDWKQNYNSRRWHSGAVLLAVHPPLRKDLDDGEGSANRDRGNCRG
jgi:hypothetical protein